VNIHLFIVICSADTYFEMGGGLNFVNAEHSNPNYWLTANLRLQPQEHFAVEPEIGSWSNNITETSCFLGCSTQTVHVRDSQLGVNVYYTFKTGSVNWADYVPSFDVQSKVYGGLRVRF
jgi:hypothetical protein